ncbi:MAG: hypothetical protein ACRDG8_08625 [Actinomycetota bacterium]
MTESNAGIPFLTELRERIVASSAAQLHRSTGPSLARRLRSAPALAAVAMLAVLIALPFVLAGRGSTPTRSAMVGDHWPRPQFGISIQQPLIEGESVEPRIAFSHVENECAGCFSRSSESQLHVKSAFVDPYGGVAFVLEDGTWIVLTPDSRSEAEYIADMKPVLDSPDLPFGLVSLRGSEALAAERGSLGPSAVMWVEGGFLFETIGGEGVPLPELMILANEL